MNYLRISDVQVFKIQNGSILKFKIKQLKVLLGYKNCPECFRFRFKRILFQNKNYFTIKKYKIKCKTKQG